MHKFTVTGAVAKVGAPTRTELLMLLALAAAPGMLLLLLQH